LRIVEYRHSASSKYVIEGGRVNGKRKRSFFPAKLGIEMRCNAFDDAFEAEIKLRPHLNQYLGKGSGNRCAWLNGITIHYRRTSPLNFRFSENGNAAIYPNGNGVCLLVAHAGKLSLN
jgi:hypothetical protein